LITKDRDYRSFEVRALNDGGMIVEGHAALFDSPTVLYEIDGIKYNEVIRRGSFDGAEMMDVVLNYNHEGKPVARTKNSTLQLMVDGIGLNVRADLSGTEEGRRLFDEIKGGYLDKMSFAFTVEEDNYNRETRTREITKFKRIFDTAVVDLPAYDGASIQARSLFEAEAEKELVETRQRERQAKVLKLKIEIGD